MTKVGSNFGGRLLVESPVEILRGIDSVEDGGMYRQGSLFREHEIRGLESALKRFAEVADAGVCICRRREEDGGLGWGVHGAEAGEGGC